MSQGSNAMWTYRHVHPSSLLVFRYQFVNITDKENICLVNSIQHTFI